MPKHIGFIAIKQNDKEDYSPFAALNASAIALGITTSSCLLFTLANAAASSASSFARIDK